MHWNQGSIVEMKDYSQIVIKNSGILYNEGAAFSNSPGAAIIVEPGGTYEISPNKTQTISTGGELNLNGGTLKLRDGATLIFDGQLANFSVNNNSTILLGENAKIIIKNGAYMNTSGSGNVFSGIAGASWQGIEFDHSWNNNIHNCTFNNAKVALKFTFDPSNLWTSSQIAYNNFNVPSIISTMTYGIYSEDMNFVGIGSNIFTLASTSSVGIYMKTTLNGIAEDPNHLYKILIYGNTFNGGNAAMVLLSYAATLKPYIIYGNTFNNNTSSIANHGIIGKQITGLIKENTLSSTKTNTDLSLMQSSLNIAHNNLGAISYNIVLNSNSNIKMAPTATNTDLILDAGYNDIYSSNSDNIQLGNYQTLLLNNGFNCFSHHGSGMEHLNGGINTTETDYYAYNNYWNPYPPDCNLHNSNNVPLVVHYSQSVACRNLSLSIDQIIDRGNGLIDTVYKAPKPSNVIIIPDEELYNQATAYMNASDYPSAILNFKSLINGYPESQYLTGALYDMYSTYQGLDTSTNQTLRDNLYSDLKTYLNEKINSGLYNSEFNDLAYNMTLMCEANMQNYNAALNGYQFIAMYHSDAITRLMASWDYVEIEALFNGMGGSVFEYENEEEFTLDISKKLQNMISRDSTMKRMKRNYEKEITRINSKTDAEINSSNHIVRDRAIEKKAKDELLIRKSINILMTSKSMTREQRAERQLEDILLVSNNGKSIGGEYTGNIIPIEYNLSQNYPNPFNPSTTIRYSIPNQSHVVLKIYDLTGREIKILVNDIKTPGNYSVSFNASELSSGIYFYKLTAGDFVQTKKMVLVK